MCVSEHLQHHQLIASMNPAFFIIYMLILSYLSLQHTNSPLFPHSWQPILVFVWLCNEPDQENDLAKKCLFDLAFFFFSVAFFFFFPSKCATQPQKYQRYRQRAVKKSEQWNCYSRRWLVVKSCRSKLFSCFLLFLGSRKFGRKLQEEKSMCTEKRRCKHELLMIWVASPSPTVPNRSYLFDI